MGNIKFGDVTEASVYYTLAYLEKPKLIDKKNAELTGRTPEFSLMSKGLGADYLISDLAEWHKKDTPNRMYCNLTDGKKTGMPRYYKDKLYTTTEKEQIKESNTKRQATLATRFTGNHRKAYENKQIYIQTARAKLSTGSKKK